MRAANRVPSAQTIGRGGWLSRPHPFEWSAAARWALRAVGSTSRKTSGPYRGTSFALLIVCASLAAAGCAGPKTLKKRDLSSVQVGEVAALSKKLGKPTYILPVTKGRYQGAQMYVYEWDKPGDNIVNRMYTYVVVSDGLVAAVFEDPADKYEKDAKAAAYAFLDSEGERKLSGISNQRTTAGALRNLAQGVAMAGSFIPVAGPALSMAGQAAGLTTQAVTGGGTPQSTTFNPVPARPAYLRTVPPEDLPRVDQTGASPN